MLPPGITGVVLNQKEASSHMKIHSSPKDGCEHLSLKKKVLLNDNILEFTHSFKNTV